MRIYDVVQGSDEWSQARLGIPTSSEFFKIITPSGRNSSQKKKYCYVLCHELIKQETLRLMEPTFWMERGSIMEHEAASAYEIMFDTQLQRAGFITDDNRFYGCSLDRIKMDENAAVEIKCPAPQTHLEHLYDQKIPNNYIPQVQGQLFVTGFDYIEWFSYHPDYEPVVIKTERDEKFQTRLRNRMGEFRTMLNDRLEKYIEMGVYDPENINENLQKTTYMAG